MRYEVLKTSSILVPPFNDLRKLNCFFYGLRRIVLLFSRLCGFDFVCFLAISTYGSTLISGSLSKDGTAGDIKLFVDRPLLCTCFLLEELILTDPLDDDMLVNLTSLPSEYYSFFFLMACCSFFMFS